MPHATHEKGALPTWLSDDERRFRASLEGLVDFYRVAQGGALFRAFWPGALISLPLGSGLMALAMRGRMIHDSFEPALTLVAIVVIASGPLWALFSLLSSMRRDDRYVAIFQEGLRLCLEVGTEPLTIPWQALEEVELRVEACRSARAPDSETYLVLHVSALADAGPRVIEIRLSFAELSLPELGRRLRDAKRLALWDRLTRPALLGS